MLLGLFQKEKNVTYNNLFIFYIVKEDKDDKLFTPSPNQYEIKLKSGSPRWTINGIKRKSLIKKSKTPGCGRYEYKTYIGEGPKYSFGRVHPVENQEKDHEEKKQIIKNLKFQGLDFIQ